MQHQIMESSASPHLSGDSEDGADARGKILRVKRGYNPNSSSVGSDIPVFIFSGMALATVNLVFLHVRDAIRKAGADNAESVMDEGLCESDENE